MAQQLPCQSDDGNLATFIGTNLNTGASETLCAPCLLQFCGTIIEGMTGLPVNALLESGPVDDEPSVDITDDDVDGDDNTSDHELYEVEHDVVTDSEHSTADVK